MGKALLDIGWVIVFFGAISVFMLLVVTYFVRRWTRDSDRRP
jgi:membrane protein implicated in regulation of membrane protease activity